MTITREVTTPPQGSVRSGSARKDASGHPSLIDRMVANGTFLLLPLLILVVIMTIASDAFLATGNLFNIMRTAAVVSIIGVGQTFVITSRNIDLSVGSMLAVVMAVVGTFVVDGLPILAAVVLAMVLGALLGALNGLIVAWLRVPALLATLGTLITFRGAVQQYMEGSYFTRFPESLVLLGQGAWGIVPVPVVLALVVATVGWLLYRYTRLGRYAVAIGGNEKAAVLAGINVRLWKVIIYAFQGTLVGLAAIVMMGRLNAAHPSVGQLMELHVIAGVVLGGTLLYGGRGFIWGTLLGMLVIGVLENGLLLAGLGFFWQQIFLGVMIIAAVALQLSRHSGRGSTE